MNSDSIVIPVVISMVMMLLLSYWERRSGDGAAPVDIQDRLYLEKIIASIHKERDAEVAQIRAEAEAMLAEMKQQYEAQITALRAEAEKMRAEMQGRIDFLLETLALRGAAEQSKPAGNQEMLVVIGEDDIALRMDLLVIRRAGMKFHRLSPASKAALEIYLSRKRKAGASPRYIHIAAHASAEGIRLSDGLADPEWLADRLDGVEVLLIAGCEGDNIGDVLAGIARYVITMTEPVTNATRPGLSDIGVFAETFWRAIQQGESVGNAYERALRASPSWIGEIAQLHTAE